MEERELKTIIESVLLVSADPLSIERLRDLMEGIDRGRILQALDSIREEFMVHGHGFQLIEVGGGYQLTTVPESAPWVRRLEKIKSSSKLSKAALEVLAIVAYRQGITRPEIEAIRGVDCGGVLKSLMERRLVRIEGRKETVGRPLMYGTSKEFLLAFGLNDLSQLPSLKEFQELTEGEINLLSPTGRSGVAASDRSPDFVVPSDGMTETPADAVSVPE